MIHILAIKAIGGCVSTKNLTQDLTQETWQPQGQCQVAASCVILNGNSNCR
jgi:hypothetical protein